MVTLVGSRHINNQWTQLTAQDQVSDRRPSPIGARAERFLVAPRPREARTPGPLRFNPQRTHYQRVEALGVEVILVDGIAPAIIGERDPALHAT